MQQLQSLLQEHKVRLTAPRKAVFQALKQAPTHLYIKDLIRQCPQVDRVSIYRTLDLFQKLDIIQPIHIGFKKAYELADPFKEHHHHIHCTSCGRVTSIQSPALETAITHTAEQHRYLLSSHHIEVWGLCEECQKEKPHQA